MAYDGAIKFTRMAIEKMRQGDLYQQNEYVKKAQAVILELATTINPGHNLELAANLMRIYEYIIKQLMEGNVSSDEAPLNESLQLLMELRATWAEIVSSQTAAA
jgi:flagellar protein FliS